LSAAPNRDDLVSRFERALTVRQGRRGGDPETRVELDHLLPDPVAGSKASARWRLATSSARLYPPPVSVEAMKVWHMGDGQKGRRLLASDLRNGNRVAAILAWHFEPGSASASQRPHLVTAAAIRKDVEDRGLQAEYMVALWLLMCVMVAIDRKTIKAGWIGLVLDGAIGLNPTVLADFGFTRGRKRAGYRGDYYTLPA
jgi:hypothetical protein